MRKARGKRYGREPLLCVLLLAMLTGANLLRKIDAIDERPERLNRLLGTNRRKTPRWVGIKRFLLEIDENELKIAIRVHARASENRI